MFNLGRERYISVDTSECQVERLQKIEKRVIEKIYWISVDGKQFRL